MPVSKEQIEQIKAMFQQHIDNINSVQEEKKQSIDARIADKKSAIISKRNQRQQKLSSMKAGHSNSEEEKK